MNQATEQDELREGYDFSKGARGKHYRAYRRGTNLVLLEPDVAATFKDAATVNAALRMLAKLAREQVLAGTESRKADGADEARS